MQLKYLPQLLESVYIIFILIFSYGISFRISSLYLSESHILKSSCNKAANKVAKDMYGTKMCFAEKQMQLFAEDSLSDVSAAEVAIHNIDKLLNLGKWKIDIDLRTTFSCHLSVCLLKSFSLFLKNDSALTCSIQLSLVPLLSVAIDGT